MASIGTIRGTIDDGLSTFQFTRFASGSPLFFGRRFHHLFQFQLVFGSKRFLAQPIAASSGMPYFFANSLRNGFSPGK